ncbi:MAG: hypothetical protein LC792_23545 [Actinobacteria bacterium]|nr:hypothetical protein [Actinomycetota bacterium]
MTFTPEGMGRATDAWTCSCSCCGARPERGQPDEATAEKPTAADDDDPPAG